MRISQKQEEMKLEETSASSIAPQSEIMVGARKLYATSAIDSTVSYIGFKTPISTTTTQF